VFWPCDKLNDSWGGKKDFYMSFMMFTARRKILFIY
jgi:hypothetical protein